VKLRGDRLAVCLPLGGGGLRTQPHGGGEAEGLQNGVLGTVAVKLLYVATHTNERPVHLGVAIDPDLPGTRPRLLPPGEEVEKGRLACTARAHEGGQRPRASEA